MLILGSIPATPTQTTLNESEKEILKNKLNQTILKIILELTRHLNILLNDPTDLCIFNKVKMNYEEAKKMSKLNEEKDKKTYSFFQKMMQTINLEIDKQDFFKDNFISLESMINEKKVRKKMIEGTALPHFKQLKENLKYLGSTILTEDEIIEFSKFCFDKLDFVHFLPSDSREKQTAA